MVSERIPSHLGINLFLALPLFPLDLSGGSPIEKLPLISGVPSRTGKGLSIASKTYDYAYEYGLENLNDEEEIKEEVSLCDYSNPGGDDGGEEIGDQVSSKPVSTSAPKNLKKSSKSGEKK